MEGEVGGGAYMHAAQGYSTVGYGNAKSLFNNLCNSITCNIVIQAKTKAHDLLSNQTFLQLAGKY